MREKAPGDWVSAADLASEDAVRELLERESGLPVFGEEAGGDDVDTGWLVDPLDGTANFLHGFDAVGVSVGLIEDGVPVVGVVHAPLLDRTSRAARGPGRVPRRRADPASATRPPEQAIVATGFPFRRKELLDRLRARVRAALRRIRGPAPRRGRQPRPLLDGRRRVRRLLRAAARARGTSPPGPIIVREAGGVVTDWEGDDRAWLRSGNILAAPPAVHAALLEIASSAP